MKIKLYLAFLVLFILGCDPVDRRLTIFNDTNSLIVPYFFLWMPETTQYNEINLGTLKNEFKDNQILPKEQKEILIKGDWDLFFENDTLVIFILDKNDIQEKGLKRNIHEYKIISKIKVSHNYAIDNNWLINVDSLNQTKFIKL